MLVNVVDEGGRFPLPARFRDGPSTTIVEIVRTSRIIFISCGKQAVPSKSSYIHMCQRALLLLIAKFYGYKLYIDALASDQLSVMTWSSCRSCLHWIIKNTLN